MRVEISEFTAALDLTRFVEKSEVFTPAQKTAVLAEIRNMVPEGVVAGQLKETAKVVREHLANRIAALADAKENKAKAAKEA